MLFYCIRYYWNLIFKKRMFFKNFFWSSGLYLFLFHDFVLHNGSVLFCLGAYRNGSFHFFWHLDIRNSRCTLFLWFLQGVLSCGIEARRGRIEGKNAQEKNIWTVWRQYHKYLHAISERWLHMEMLGIHDAQVSPWSVQFSGSDYSSRFSGRFDPHTDTEPGRAGDKWHITIIAGWEWYLDSTDNHTF